MPGLTTVLLDTHVLHWWRADPGRLSPVAVAAIDESDDIAVAGITWYELAWLATRHRIALGLPTGAWLERMADQILTIGITPAIANIAASLPRTFPSDPADRLIYATAIENGWRLITKDERMHAHRYPRPVALW